MIDILGAITICAIPGLVHRALIPLANGEYRTSRQRFTNIIDARRYSRRWLYRVIRRFGKEIL